MSTTATIRLYDMLKPKLGESEARAFIQNFEESFEENFASKAHELATKGDLKVAIAESKVDVIKWMVGLWIAQMAAIVGLYLTR